MNQRLSSKQLQITQQGETEIVVRRSFAHPPARVWRTMTDPALIPKWMASLDPMTGCQMDARSGGSFRYDWSGEERSFYFSGPVLQADAPRSLSVIEYFNGDQSSGTHVITDLAEEGAGTRMTIIMRWPTPQARAAAVESGMTDGFTDVYDRLDALLAT